MSVGVVITIILVLLFLLKLYVYRGMYQASLSLWFTRSYFAVSALVFFIGVAVFYRLFTQGGAPSFWSNFFSALMFTFTIVELLMSAVFFLDDVLIFFNWIGEKFTRKETVELVTERRRFIKMAGLGLAAIPFASFLYGITKGKYAYKIHKVKLAAKDLPKAFHGFKIVQFSDFHSGSFDSLESVKRGVDLMQEQNADLILFTGDIVNSDAKEILPYNHLLKNLSAPFGKYAVLGNHDYAIHGRGRADQAIVQQSVIDVSKNHQDAGFEMLHNRNVTLKKDGEQIKLVGVENWGTGFIQRGDIHKAYEGVKDGEFNILMSHDPTHWDAQIKDFPKKVHLTLSGHTHGTQMGVEIGDFKWSPSKYIYKQWAGLYTEGEQNLYVNRGFGFLGFAGRVGILPEITVIELEQA